MKTPAKTAQEPLPSQELAVMFVDYLEQRVPVEQLSFNGTSMVRPDAVNAFIMAAAKGMAIVSMIGLHVRGPASLFT